MFQNNTKQKVLSAFEEILSLGYVLDGAGGYWNKAGLTDNRDLAEIAKEDLVTKIIDFRDSFSNIYTQNDLNSINDRVYAYITSADSPLNTEKTIEEMIDVFLDSAFQSTMSACRTAFVNGDYSQANLLKDSVLRSVVHNKLLWPIFTFGCAHKNGCVFFPSLSDAGHFVPIHEMPDPTEDPHTKYTPPLLMFFPNEDNSQTSNFERNNMGGVEGTMINVGNRMDLAGEYCIRTASHFTNCLF